MPLSPGSDFGSYHLIRPLGQGGFAEVWEAESATTGRRVALKVLTQLPTATTSSNALERFRQEGRLAAALFHPRCVYVFDAGAVHGLPYISMELMPGGTLADRIKHGPLPAAQAVDYVIDMLDGLEAAHAAGIIHRDIKPSNVFLDEQGRARIGDFGISKSLESTTALTATGGFLGTPQYASPEQAGGEAIDSRSDLYSAGTVLYELLTGEAPFGAENPAQALARVLTQPPPPFPARALVPLGLQRVVYRLLAKQKEKRFQSSAAARDALAPYSSRGVTVADIARRLVAIVVDLVLLSFVGTALGRFAFQHPLTTTAVSLLLVIGYFAITEGLAGASIGKWLAGLMVVTRAERASRSWRVPLRSVLFVLCYSGIPSAVGLFAPSLSPLVAIAAQIFGLGLVCSTMRRANGFAGLHEVLSGTRVMAVQALERAAVVPEEPPATTPVPATVPAFGPYHATGVIWAGPGAAVYVAHDDELRRDVWIHAVARSAGTTLPTTDELRLRGAGSLPWLQRGETAGEVWDAYGAPHGIAFEPWARRGRLPWRVMRRVLGSLGRELDLRIARGGVAPGDLSPARVWVTSAGDAQLLDFPLAPSPAFRAPPPDWQRLLREVAAQGLHADDAEAPPRVPLPVRARALLARLWGVGTAFSRAGEVALALDAEGKRPAAITRERRLATLFVPAVVPAVLLITPLLQSGAQYPPWFYDLVRDRPDYMGTLRRSAAAPTDTVLRRVTAAIQLVLAEAVKEARRTPRLGAQILSFMPAGDLALLDSAGRRYPDATAKSADSARAWLATHRAAWTKPGMTSFTIGLVVLGAFGAIGVVLAFILRGPPLLHLAGISVARTDGSPAGRVRCAARSLVAWAPLIAFLYVHRFGPGWQIPVAALAGAGIVFSLLHPERGVADRVMRTVLVPK